MNRSGSFLKRVITGSAGNKWLHGLLATTIVLCGIPFFGLLLFFIAEYASGTSSVSAPPLKLLIIFAVTGGVLPLIGLGVILKKLIDDRVNFKLAILLEGYFSIIIIFASMYALLQASSLVPAFSGVTVMWTTSPLPLSDHLWHLIVIFLEFIYLSIMTITTVGYGDIVPISAPAKMLTAIEGLLGIGFIGIVLGNYFSVCMHKGRKS